MSTSPNTKLIMKRILTTLLPLAFALLASGQPGSLDPTFDHGMGVYNNVWTSALQADGKIVIGGTFPNYTGANTRIARLNTDGSLDASFNPGSGANNVVVTSALQSDGKIIIGGNFTSYNGTGINRIARLHADGSLDTSFDPGIGMDGYGYIFSVAVQADGKILVGGIFNIFNAHT